MKPLSILSLLASFVALAPLPAHAQKLNPGLWEHQFSMNSQSGRMEQALREAQQAMASMPPDQRRMMQEMMARQGMAMGPQGNSVKLCISKEQAERDTPPPAQEGCTQNAKRSGNTWQLSFKCPGPPPSSGDGTLTLQSPTAYSGTFQLLSEVDGKPEKMSMTTTGKWLGANCGSIKPASP